VCLGGLGPRSPLIEVNYLRTRSLKGGGGEKEVTRTVVFLVDGWQAAVQDAAAAEAIEAARQAPQLLEAARADVTAAQSALQASQQVPLPLPPLPLLLSCSCAGSLPASLFSPSPLCAPAVMLEAPSGLPGGLFTFSPLCAALIMLTNLAVSQHVPSLSRH
jgi:hypothetical protein